MYQPYITELLGRAITEWYQIDDAMRSHDIKDGKELSVRLGGTATRIEVRDHNNQDRLLGTMPMRHHTYGRYFQIPIYKSAKVSYYDFDPPSPSLSLDTVIFEFGHHGDMMVRRLCYLTAQPLDKLMKIDCFRLPGETERQAKERRYSQQY